MRGNLSCDQLKTGIILWIIFASRFYLIVLFFQTQAPFYLCIPVIRTESQVCEGVSPNELESGNKDKTERKSSTECPGCWIARETCSQNVPLQRGGNAHSLLEFPLRLHHYKGLFSVILSFIFIFLNSIILI